MSFKVGDRVILTWNGMVDIFPPSKVYTIIRLEPNRYETYNEVDKTGYWFIDGDDEKVASASILRLATPLEELL